MEDYDKNTGKKLCNYIITTKWNTKEHEILLLCNNYTFGLRLVQYLPSFFWCSLYDDKEGNLINTDVINNMEISMCDSSWIWWNGG